MDDSRQTYRTDTPSAHTIFYYNADRLLSYERGLYLEGAELSEDASSAENQSVVLLPAKTGVMDMFNIIFGGENYMRIYTADGTYNTLGTETQASKAKAYDFRDRMVLALPVVTDNSGWAAFSSPVPVTIPQGCVAYIADGYDNVAKNISLSQLAPGTTIGANTGILLKAEPSSVVEFAISESGCSYEQNVMQPSVAVTQAGNDKNAYVPVFGGDRISFRLLDATQRTIPAHSAWLQTDDADAPSALSVSIPGEETSVNEIHSVNGSASAIFNIQGQRLSSPQSGINIVDGKKVLVK